MFPWLSLCQSRTLEVWRGVVQGLCHGCNAILCHTVTLHPLQVFCACLHGTFNTHLLRLHLRVMNPAECGSENRTSFQALSIWVSKWNSIQVVLKFLAHVHKARPARKRTTPTPPQEPTTHEAEKTEIWTETLDFSNYFLVVMGVTIDDSLIPRNIGIIAGGNLSLFFPPVFSRSFKQWGDGQDTGKVTEYDLLRACDAREGKQYCYLTAHNVFHGLYRRTSAKNHR